MATYRPLTDHDLLKYAQENQALLKTILFMLEQQTANPTESQRKNAQIYREYLEGIQVTFEIATRLTE